MEVYAAKPAHRLSLRQLLFFGRQMDEHRIIKASAAAQEDYTQLELPLLERQLCQDGATSANSAQD
ncbi:hypothetical protein FRC12_000003 [Ceratobasidium sp. 428]|nr:hypothetical protein FRC12_000003 [Ceratobasidium sp. 428]